jgi:hypothetical protein
MNLPKTSIIYSFLENNNIESGNAKVFYHFTGASGYLIYNDLHSHSAHTNSSDQLLASFIPGISVGQDDEIQDTSAGVGDNYGYFNSSGAVKLGAPIDYDGWTVFMHINEQQATPPQSSLVRDRSRVLLSSMLNPTSISGFNIGLNGANRLYFEYPTGYTSTLKTFTLPEEVGTNILFSASLGVGSGDLELSLHDIPNKKNYVKKFHNLATASDSDQTLSEFKHSDKWYIGNFKTPGGDLHTGYSGYIDSFLLISGYVGEESRNDIAKTYFISGYTEETEVSSPVTGYSKNSYAFVNPTGFLNRGVTSTGYSLLETLTDPDGASVPIYSTYDISGDITGQIVDYHTSTDEVVTEEIITQPAVEYYRPENIQGACLDTFVFIKDNTDADDDIEIYSYLTGTANHNLRPSYVPGDGIYQLDSAHTGEKVNLYRNGLLQAEESQDLNLTGFDFNYVSYTTTGYFEVGPEHGVVSGQKYYVDFSYDYISGGAGSGSVGVSAGCLGAGDSMAIITGNTPSNFGNEFGNVGGVGQHTIKTSGYVTASRDGLTLLHSGTAGTLGDNKTKVNIKLTYDADYSMTGTSSIYPQVNPSTPGGNTASVDFDSETDVFVYDKMDHNNQSKYFVYTGQERADGLYGKKANGELDLKSYYIGEADVNSDTGIAYDAYLHGQKLTSGVEYNLVSQHNTPEMIRFDTTKFDPSTGLIQMAPLTSGSKLFNRDTENGASRSIDTVFEIVGEQVWKNGQRQIKDSDYTLVSDSSLLRDGVIVPIQSGATVYSTTGKAGSVGFGIV